MIKVKSLQFLLKELLQFIILLKLTVITYESIDITNSLCKMSHPDLEIKTILFPIALIILPRVIIQSSAQIASLLIPPPDKHSTLKFLFSIPIKPLFYLLYVIFEMLHNLLFIFK